MSITLTLADVVPDDTPVLGVPFFEGRPLEAVSGTGAELDLAYLAARRFEGSVGEALAVPAEDGTTVVVIGMGRRDKVTAETLRRSAAAFVRAAWHDPEAATTILAAVPAEIDLAIAGQAIAEGATLAAYGFTRYKGSPKPCQLESLTVVGKGVKARRGLERGERIAAAVAMARDLVNEPAGAMTPARLADVASELAARDGLDLTVWDETQITNERLGGLLGVAAGSEEPPRLIELVYDPPGARSTVALVGKGITFDSGGLSIKSAEGMETMKTDMSGAAAVLATMSTLRALAPKVKVIAIVPTTENMPGGRATKPGDVLTIRNGKTVEV
nr:leucyl aminopeptidase [Actinomycetota bacterium]